MNRPAVEPQDVVFAVAFAGLGVLLLAVCAVDLLRERAQLRRECAQLATLGLDAERRADAWASIAVGQPAVTVQPDRAESAG